jgi:hypothetical protein
MSVSVMIAWIDNDIPSVMWISGLFFPQSILTGVLQNYARSHRLAIDEINFDFDFNAADIVGTPTTPTATTTVAVATSSSDEKRMATTSSPRVNERKLTKPSDGIYIRVSPLLSNPF